MAGAYPSYPWDVVDYEGITIPMDGFGLSDPDDLTIGIDFQAIVTECRNLDPTCANDVVSVMAAVLFHEMQHILAGGQHPCIESNIRYLTMVEMCNWLSGGHQLSHLIDTTLLCGFLCDRIDTWNNASLDPNDPMNQRELAHHWILGHCESLVTPFDTPAPLCSPSCNC